MYRSNATRCPSCHNELTALPTTLALSGCFTCGGMWLGPEATVHLLRGLGGGVEQEIAAASAETARTSLVPAPDSGSRECPTCGLEMLRLGLAEIEIDSCPTHGAFFDRNEVQVVVDACRRLRRRDAPGLGNAALAFIDSLHAGASKVLGATFAGRVDEVGGIPKVPKDE